MKDKKHMIILVNAKKSICQHLTSFHDNKNKTKQNRLGIEENYFIIKTICEKTTGGKFKAFLLKSETKQGWILSHFHLRKS